jgi:hypothetical protein
LVAKVLLALVASPGSDGPKLAIMAQPNASLADVAHKLGDLLDPGYPAAKWVGWFPSRDAAITDEPLCVAPENGRRRQISLQECRVVILTVAAATRKPAWGPPLLQGQLDAIVVDEAQSSHAHNLPDLIPLLRPGGDIEFVADERQLPAHVANDLGDEYATAARACAPYGPYLPAWRSATSSLALPALLNWARCAFLPSAAHAMDDWHREQLQQGAFAPTIEEDATFLWAAQAIRVAAAPTARQPAPVLRDTVAGSVGLAPPLLPSCLLVHCGRSVSALSALYGGAHHPEAFSRVEPPDVGLSALPPSPHAPAPVLAPLAYVQYETSQAWETAEGSHRTSGSGWVPADLDMAADWLGEFLRAFPARVRRHESAAGGRLFVLFTRAASRDEFAARVLTLPAPPRPGPRPSR